MEVIAGVYDGARRVFDLQSDMILCGLMDVLFDGLVRPKTLYMSLIRLTNPTPDDAAWTDAVLALRCIGQ